MKTKQGYGQNRKIKFWEHKHITPSGCWEWLGCRNIKGYGQQTVNGKPKSVHRIAWEARYGSTNGLWVLHKCDNPACYNPDHLFLGTAQDNVKDMWAKGRGWRPAPSTRKPRCHPDRPYLARGLCSACY